MEYSLLNAASAILAAGYAYFVYSTEAVDLFFKYAIMIGAFCASALSLLFSYSKYFQKKTIHEFISSTIFYMMLIAGLMLTATVLIGIGTRNQILIHCAAFAPVGIAFLAAKINFCTAHRRRKIISAVLMSIAAVVPFFLLVALASLFLMPKKEHTATCSPFLAKADPLAALVCDVFFTMSILHGFFISLTYALQPTFAYGITASFFYGGYHIIPFTIALIILFRVRGALTLNGLLFYLCAAPSAIIPGYVLIPLAYLVFKNIKQPKSISKTNPPY